MPIKPLRIELSGTLQQQTFYSISNLQAGFCRSDLWPLNCRLLIIILALYMISFSFYGALHKPVTTHFEVFYTDSHIYWCDPGSLCSPFGIIAHCEAFDGYQESNSWSQCFKSTCAAGKRGASSVPDTEILSIYTHCGTERFNRSKKPGRFSACYTTICFC